MIIFDNDAKKLKKSFFTDMFIKFSNFQANIIKSLIPANTYQEKGMRPIHACPRSLLRGTVHPRSLMTGRYSITEWGAPGEVIISTLIK